MNIVIKFRKSKCDVDTYFYDLYIDDIWVCGFYSLDVIKLRVERYIKYRK